MIIPNIWKNKNVPNHQPVYIQYDFRWLNWVSQNLGWRISPTEMGTFFWGQPWSAQNSGIPTKNRGIIPSFGVDGERHVILPLTLDFRRFVLAVESRNSPSNSDSFNRQNDDKTWDLAMEYSGYDIYIHIFIYPYEKEKNKPRRLRIFFC